MKAVSFAEFAAADPEFAAHVEARIGTAPCFVATIRKDGGPRVHPVGPFVLRDGHLIVNMYPTSPKRHDLLRDPRFALHGPCEDTRGGAGEVLINGVAHEVEPSQYDIEHGYIAFEFLIADVLATRYKEGDATKPARRIWRADAAVP